MYDEFIGQIVMAGFNFAPRDFALCDGRLLPVNQYQGLFSLLGITYGGNGSTTFGLPDLRGTTPVGAGPSADMAFQPTPYKLGERAGQEKVLLTSTPPHTHGMRASSKNEGSARSAVNALYGNSGTEAIYADASGPRVRLEGDAIAAVGGTGHDNMQPYQVLNFAIALTGIYPSRN